MTSPKVNQGHNHCLLKLQKPHTSCRVAVHGLWLNLLRPHRRSGVNGRCLIVSHNSSYHFLVSIFAEFNPYYKHVFVGSNTRCCGCISILGIYNSMELKMMPQFVHALSKQVFTFEAVIRCVTSISGNKQWREQVQNIPFSLARFGYNGHMTGLRPRPALLHQARTLEVLRQCIIPWKDAKLPIPFT